MTFTGSVYDKLKFITQVLLPALGTLYFTLAGTWNLPSAEQVVGTIVALDTFLGVVLHISSASYAKSDARFDGVVNVDDSEEKKTFSLVVNTHPDDIDKQNELRLKVNSPKKG